jgi:TonB-linked SusC/RagA family outer membrane protein
MNLRSNYSKTRNIILVMLFALFFPLAGIAGTTRIITGRVVSQASQEPIIGAVVIVPGTPTGTNTDVDGNYKIEVPDTAKALKFSFLGMKTKVVALSNANALKLVEMTEETKNISEVVVVGFGTQKKESVIGSIQVLKGSELTVPSSSLTTAFAGKIAGVIAVQRSGEPGADGASFWIRGISTFAGPTSPLIVMDGVEISAADLNAVAPESIESFSILKDATATALYGAKGANGVMVVTTKSGQDLGKPHVNARFEYFITQPNKLPSFVGGADYMRLYNQSILTRDPNATPYYSDQQITATEQHLNPYIYPDVNWYDLLFKGASQNMSANLNVTGGSKKVDYFINASVFNETGMYRDYKESQFDSNNIHQHRYSFQTNINAKLSETTKVGLHMMTQIRDADGPGETSNLLFNKAMQANPVEFPAMFPAEEGSKHIFYGNKSNFSIGNPLALLLSRQKNEFETNILSAFNLEQKLDFVTKGLSARGLISFQFWSKKASTYGSNPFFYELSSYDPTTYAYTISQMQVGEESVSVKDISHWTNNTINIQAAVDYNRTFGEDHDVSGMLLYHQREYRTPSWDFFGNLPYREQGLAGRFTYNYKTRYFTEFNFGYNGSENFKKGHRFGFFPSIAVGYLISNEDFFQKYRKVISLLKIRGSYGLVGNSFTDPRFPYITEVVLNDGNRGYTFGEQWNNHLNGYTISKYGEAGAKWETGKKINGGIEIGLFNEFTLIADIFKETRSGIFMQRRVVPTTVGIGSALPYANIGKVENKGVDMSMEFNHAFRPDFILSIKGNFTYAANKLLDRDEPAQVYSYQSEIGHPLNSPYGLIAEGLYTDQDIIDMKAGKLPKPTFDATVMAGDIKYKDLNGDNVIDGFDRTFIGKPSVPEIVYGIGATVKYKKIDASVFFQGVANTTLVMSGMHPFGNYRYQVYKFIAKSHWSEDNPDPNAAYPRLSANDSQNNTQASTFWAKDGSFLRLKNAEIGYTFKQFRIYANGTNLLTFSKFKYWDPEVGGYGIAYPTLRVFNFGIQLNFN